jgi:8-oxo-dGTP pyrophosphatase MutT (NUDIX family)
MSEFVPPRAAATVLLVRDGGSGLEVFMVTRHHAIDFASGALVFPGGKVEAEDHAIAADPRRRGAIGELAEAEGASRVAAVRETFEECGILFARPRGGRALLDGARCAEIRATARSRSFAGMLDVEDLELALDELTPFAHWITPPIMPKRFDTRFYISIAPEDQIAHHDGSESVDSVWLSPEVALADAESGKHTLVFATKLNLRMLGESATAASALAAARARKIVAVEPVATRTGSGYTLRIPSDAGYGGDSFSI